MSVFSNTEEYDQLIVGIILTISVIVMAYLLGSGSSDRAMKAYGYTKLCPRNDIDCIYRRK